MVNKILFIAPSNSIHSYKWISYFSDKENYDVTWISFYENSNHYRNKKNIKFYNLSKNTLSNFLTFKKIISNNKFSLVHLHYIGKFSYMLLLFNIRKLIVTPWGSDVKFLNKFSIKYLIIKQILKRASIITVDANYMIDLIQKIYNSKNIHRINFGTDTEFFKPNNISKNPVFKIISLRNLETIYSIDTLINAVDILINQYNLEIHLDIYGDGSERENLANLINKLSLDNYIKLKGRYNYIDLPTIINSYDLYISTSTSDAGLAASTSEAMSCGIISLVSDNSENSFWMSEDSGFLFETSSYKHLAIKIKEIYEMDVKKKELIKNNSRKKIIKFNSFQGEMHKMNLLYLSMNEKN